jgi:hypothetical protein
VHEVLGEFQPAVDLAEQRVGTEPIGRDCS